MRDDIDLLFKYRRWRPDRVTLPGSAYAIYVDPTENRGRAILRCFAAGQPHIKRLWRRAHAALAPDAVLDVGANYGELLFLERYEPGARVIGIEANPQLEPYLERSRREHPCADQIELYCALAAAEADEGTLFYIDDAWSGRSSVLLDGSAPTVRAERVPAITIDSLFSRPGATLPRRLLFKIDVEGYEPRVLAGMKTLIDSAEVSIGVIEFNVDFLRKLEVDIEAYLGGLAEQFALYRAEPDGSFAAVTPRELCGPRQVGENDLLLLSHASLIDKLSA